MPTTTSPAGLTAAQQALFDRLRSGSARAAAPTIPPAPDPSRVPLTYAQERIWLSQQLVSDPAIYHFATAVRVPGGVTADELGERLTGLARRYDALRVSVHAEDGVPFMRRAATVPVDIRPLQVAVEPGESVADAIRRTALAFARLPYRLEEAPLWRVGLADLPDGDSLFVLAVHHLIVDGPSLGILGTSLLDPGAVAPPPVEFIDYAAWLRSQEGGGPDAHDRWWVDQLADVPSALALGHGARPGGAGTVAGETIRHTFDPALDQAVRRFARDLGSTPFVVVLAALARYLQAAAPDDRMLLGLSVTDRQRPETAGMVGVLMNLVPLLLDLSGPAPFPEVVRRVGAGMGTAISHSRTPFDRLPRLLRAEGREMPRLQVCVNQPVPELDYRGMDVVDLPMIPVGAQFDLTLHVVPTGGGLQLQAEYATAVLDRDGAQTLLDGVVQICRDAVAEAIRPTLPDAVTEPPAPSESDPLEDLPLPLAVRRQAALTPHRCAVETADGPGLDYAGLVAAADRVAGWLRRAGVRPGASVLVAGRRDADLLPALLGCWFAGAGFLPLDVDQPAARFVQLVTEGRPAAVLAAAGFRLPTAVTVPTLDLSHLSDLPALSDLPDLPGSAPGGPHAVHPTDIAYGILTSGSTGRPKIAAVTHSAVANRVRHSRAGTGLTAEDRVLQKTRIGFDAAVWELFAPLTVGGAVVLASPGVESDPDALLAELTRRRVSVLQAVPTVLRALLTVAGPDEPIPLRLVCSAGEPLEAELCRALSDHGVAGIENTYGPAECAIDVTAHRWSTADPDRIPIGRPIAGAEVTVVDPELTECAADRPGELWLRGRPVGAGYLHRPDLTAAAFVPDPWGPPGARAYRSGDRGRRDPGGELHFLGRQDDQVKINGVRVEPAEVAAALRAEPSVRAAAVLAVPDPQDARPVLTAFVVSDADPTDLRARLRTQLPGAAVPSRWLRLDVLPQTAGGKLDQVALRELALRSEPAPDEHRPTGSASTGAASRVAAVWAELLPGAEPAPEDDFFALGGHSMLLARLAARLSAVAGHEIGVAELFTRTTLAAQVELLADAVRPPEPTPVPGPDLPPTRRVVLSATQARLWFLHQLEPASPQYVVPWLQALPPGVTEAQLTRAFGALAARHDVLRTRFVDDGPEPYAEVAGTATVALTSHDVPADQARELVSDLVERPFDLASGAWRVDLVRTDAGHTLLVFAAHHIICDGESLDVLTDELAEFLRSDAEGRPAELRPDPPQFAPLAAVEKQWRSSPSYRSQLDQWRDRLAGASATELPVDRPRPPTWDTRGGVVTFTLPPAVVGGLTALGRAGRSTPFMTRLALVVALLWRRGSADEVVVGTPVAARLRPGVEQVVGPLTNTVVLRTGLDPADGFASVLEQVRNTCLWSLERQEVGFDDVVEVVQPPRDLSRNPLFQIMVETDGLRGIENADEMAWSTAKFDLTVGFTDEPDGSVLGYLEYASALFDVETVQLFAADLVGLAAAVVADPLAPVGYLPRPGAAEAARPVDPPSAPADLRATVAAHARRQPDVSAVEAGGVRLSYAELDARVGAAAARLHRLGVGVGDVVAVCAERGIDVVVALLALLEVGAAYLPLHPGHPTARRARMAALAGARLVLDAGTLDDLGIPSTDLAAVTAPGPRRTGPPTLGSGAVSDRELAYVLFTSGSTGDPKGVSVDRRAYAQHCAVIAAACGVVAGERVAQLSSLVFDVAMEQMGSTLLVGATLVVAGPEDWDPRELADWVAEHRVSTMEVTPAHYRAMIATVGPGDRRLAGLRLMNVGSDVVVAADAQAWYGAAVHGQFLVGYGPTEATVTCAVQTLPPEDVSGLDPVTVLPLGRPVAGTTARVLDRWLQPVAPGGIGELYLGGDRLARGYVGRFDLTADRFVPDPFGPPGARLYRTGDAVRRRPDGVLEFHGRLDRQVKVRGFRIEPGEIEAHLGSHPSVTAAVVGVRDDRLTAFVVGPAPIDPAALRDHLAGTLPGYLVPAVWAQVAELPLTDSGKIDRARLLAGPVRALRAAYQPPDDPVAEQVAVLWTELLGIERVGRADDFFLLGGHSLLAVRLHAALRERFAVDLPLRVLFERSTLGGLADAVHEAVAASVDALSDDEVDQLLAEEEDR